MIDLHIHTARCGHAEGQPADYVRRALELGIATIAMTDHLPLPQSVLLNDPRTAEYAMPERELFEYTADVEAVRDEAAERGLQVLVGIEADHLPGEREFTARLLGSYPFDMVLGSVHMIDGWTFDDPDRLDGYERWDIGALWERYFSEVADAARSGLYDVLGHIDLVKKFRFVPGGDLDPLYSGLTEAIAGTGVAVEINTAGLRKPCAELYPAVGLLRHLRSAGVPLTIGSDAHSPQDVGYGYDLAVEALKSVGYDSLVVFERRVPREVGL